MQVALFRGFGSMGAHGRTTPLCQTQMITTLDD